MQGEENIACQRGCRLYTVSKLIPSYGPVNPENVEESGQSHALAVCQRCKHDYFIFLNLYIL